VGSRQGDVLFHVVRVVEHAAAGPEPRLSLHPQEVACGLARARRNSE